MFCSFESKDTDIEKLMQDIECGKVQLPDFQRGWNWNNELIRNLIASITCSYPIGVMILLQCESNPKFYWEPVKGSPAANKDKTPEFLILDGQQRLTSIYRSMYSKESVDTTDDGKEVKYFYYVDIEKAIDSSFDRIDSIIAVPESKIITSNSGRKIELDLSSREKEFKNKMFPLNIIFDSVDKWYRGYLDYHKNDKVIESKYDKFKDNVIKSVTSYKISRLLLDKETDLEAVCKVFENVNTGGITLTSFELVTAMFAKDGFRLRDDWDKIKAENFSEGIFKATDAKKEVLSSTDFLTACRIFAGYKSGKYNSQTKCKKNEVLNLTVDEYKNYKDIIIDGFLEAQTFLKEERIFVPKNLPYTTQLIPLAVICAIFCEDGIIHTDFAREKIRRWFWCGVFGEIYKGGANYGHFVNDISDMTNWVKDENFLPKTISDAQFNPLDLKKFKSRNSAIFKGFVALIMKNGSKDFINGSTMDFQSYENENIDMHHIFPKKFCEKQDEKIYVAEKWKSILNQTPISSDSNKIIGGNSPEDYLKKILNERKVSSRKKLDEILKSHGIEPEDLRGNNF